MVSSIPKIIHCHMQCTSNIGKCDCISVGRFFFRFPEWRKWLDVYSRTTSFLSTLFRDSAQMRGSGVDLNNMNIVIVTHGLAIRLFFDEMVSVQCGRF